MSPPPKAGLVEPRTPVKTGTVNAINQRKKAKHNQGTVVQGWNPPPQRLDPDPRVMTKLNWGVGGVPTWGLLGLPTSGGCDLSLRVHPEERGRMQNEGIQK